MSYIAARGISKYYKCGEQDICALVDINLDLSAGQFVVLVGRSGSGKTTFLRLLAGLDEKSFGTFNVKGQEVLGRLSLSCSVVFQEPRLMPWLTVKENVAFSSGHSSRSKDLDGEILDVLELTRYANSYPNQLSGGLAQRVAVARAFCCDTEIILMDEPFSSLDFFTRNTLHKWLMELHKKRNVSVLLVTHDLEEALLLAQRILVLKEGKLVGDISLGDDFLRDRNDNLFRGKWKYLQSIL